jgi:hypothetical protein
MLTTAYIICKCLPSHEKICFLMMHGSCMLGSLLGLVMGG